MGLLNRPFELNLFNNSADIRVVTLFGYVDNINKPNFGIPKDVIVSSLPNVEYKQLLLLSFSHGIDIKAFEVFSSTPSVLHSFKVRFITQDVFGRIGGFVATAKYVFENTGVSSCELPQAFTINPCSKIRLVITGKSELKLRLFQPLT